MRVGAMRYRVVVQKPLNDTARRGIPQQWEDVATVWASIRQNKTSETKDGPKRVVIGEYEIRLWSIDGLDETYRIKHGEKIYNIIQADEPNPLVKETVLLTKRDKHNG